jgi:predicted DNA-binding protein (MmcQ/YjbR family)
MNIEEIRDFCLSLKGVEESFPFDNNTLVFKVGGKIFLLVALDAQPLRFNAKCDPEKAIKLRETYSYVLPGFHMNKQHWNTIVCESNSSRKLLTELIKESYSIVLMRLPKSKKAMIEK